MEINDGLEKVRSNKREKGEERIKKQKAWNVKEETKP